MKNIYLQILDKLQDNSPMALATITTTTGSTPQKPGSSALFGPAGIISGTVGGGIMEAKVQQIAQNLLVSKKSGQYHFNLNHDIDKQEEAICGGQASVLVEALSGNHAYVFGQMKKSMDQRIPGVLVTRVNSMTGDQVDIQRSWVTQFENYDIQPVLSPEMVSVLKRLFLNGKAGDYIELISSDSQNEERIYLEPVFPYPQLVIAGAGHIGKALAHLGNLLEFEVWVVDERDDYANFENIPDADHMIADDIGKVIESIKITPDTYIVIVTRGHKNDADSLKSCIGSEAGYIGMIGSKKKIALMRQNFMEKGWATSNQWKQVHAPIGLDIHSKTVQEIAVSIAAQLIEVRNKKRMHMPETCAIVLAAGESLRMKTNKLLLPFNGKLMLTTVIDNIFDAGVDHILVVLGGFREEMDQVVSKLLVMSCYNGNYKQGMVTSVQCGFRHMPATSEAAIIFLGDQPMIPGRVTRQVIQAHKTSGKGIVIPVYKGKRGHPVLIHRKYAGEIEDLDPAAGMRTLITRHSDDIQEVDSEIPGILRDIDTEEEYRKVTKLK